MSNFSMSIKDDLADLTKKLTNLQKEQIPYATGEALTATTWNARLFAQDGMMRDLSKPKAFTLNAFKVQKATKRNLTAHIELKPIQAQYLGWTLEAGTKARAQGIPVPISGVRMTKGRYEKLLSQPDVFRGMIKGIEGLWRREPYGRVKLLFVIKREVDYDPYAWRYYRDVERAIAARFPVHFNREMVKALATAR